MTEPIIGAYYYPGWSKCPIRDAAFPPNWSEWDLLRNCKPRFEGHEQPNIPLWGFKDDSLPVFFDLKVKSAVEHKISVFIFAFYWSHGKRLLEGALNKGFLNCPSKDSIKFALMWANRMPRRVLPVKNSKARMINPSRLIYTDPDDFLNFVQFCGKWYFVQPNYFRLNSALYLSIFDSTFFLRQMGQEGAKSAIERARSWLRENGFGELHLSAINPARGYFALAKNSGFDSCTHYVFLPEWEGPFLQDYREMTLKRRSEWPESGFIEGLSYFPSVAPGWDASPRAADFPGKERPNRYPWGPIIINRSPEAFHESVSATIRYSQKVHSENPLFFISSWNEWTEGHYLEPDQNYGYRWLEAVKAANHG